ncbi:hypothetical protein Daura_35470 [Dactylosporangium aurantiacum]|uniref:Uncharacterized protein n=1 Tax=Dactylosporangium aurantiacum TaxID=35754 RepID=A0A9Q9IUZ2_9ACTN|nr:hypothetical protein [Dactylosporangium aurantiacum]MDG6103528.1 hypothetical protein [Dactylosporangium aurantiacum]UWZ60247.1 hypothetical protein Daura_35470 [Dactylosporangium aurantiacum]
MILPSSRVGWNPSQPVTSAYMAPSECGNLTLRRSRMRSPSAVASRVLVPSLPMPSQAMIAASSHGEMCRALAACAWWWSTR